MRNLYYLSHFSKRYRLKRASLYIVSLMIFFWAIYDGIVSYVTPILITNAGLSNTEMGLILGTSSIAGAIFDFILSKYLSNIYYRRIYLFVFALCFLYPLILWQAKTVWIFLLAMVLWGLYYDFQNMATFDFVSEESESVEHSSSFGVLQVFKSLGYLLAPIIVGYILITHVNWRVFTSMWLFLFISFLFFLLLFVFAKKHKDRNLHKRGSGISVLMELSRWRKVGKIILPVLIFTTLLGMIDAFFWTVGPLLSEHLSGVDSTFGGLFMTAYTLPVLLVSWFAKHVEDKVGKKRGAFLSLILGALFLCFLFVSNSPFIILLVVFVFSAASSLAWPLNNATYADYMSESPELDKEIEALADFFTNIGYIVGPITAGILVDAIGYLPTFSSLGVVSVIITLILLAVTPKAIKVKIS